MASDEERPIRIVDRRMFTPEGDLRPDFQAEEPAEPQPRPAMSAPHRPAASAVPPPAAKEPPSSAAGGEETLEEPADPRSDFASLVRSLATTAYSALGLLPDPAGARRRDPAVARQMIDWLAVLEQKTRGNISFEESDFLSKVVYELRL